MEATRRNIFVIGGSRGIGAAIVRGFADAGDKVTFTYAGAVDAATALAEETGTSAVRSDAADRDAIIATVAEQSPIDVLVYNAGLFVAGDPLTLDPDAIDRMIDVNLRNVYHASVEAARAMPSGARIIMIGSNHGDRAVLGGVSAYAMTKSALQGMARGLARDFGARDITVNVIQPGPTDTDMNPADGQGVGKMYDVMAIKRHNAPADIASLALYLASHPARGITGAMMTIDGGFTA